MRKSTKMHLPSFFHDCPIDTQSLAYAVNYFIIVSRQWHSQSLVGGRWAPTTIMMHNHDVHVVVVAVVVAVAVVVLVVGVALGLILNTTY